MNSQFAGVWRQGAAGHFRSEMRPADSDIHYIGEALASARLALALADLSTEASHRLQGFSNSRPYVLILDNQRRSVGISKGGMQGRPALSLIDQHSVEHCVPLAAYISFSGKRYESLASLVVYSCFGIVE